MRAGLILAIFFLGLWIQVLAQSTFPDSVRHCPDRSVQARTATRDSAAARINQKIDSTRLRINNALNLNLNVLTRRIRFDRRPSLDSLSSVYNLDSIKGGLRNKIDSLGRLNLSTDRYTSKLDSLNQIGPAKCIQMAEAKANALQDKINRPADKIENKVNETLGRLNAEGGTGANLPGSVNFPNARLNTDLNQKTKLDLPKTDLNLENPLGKVENPLKDQMGEVGELKEKANDLKSVPAQQIEKINSVEELKNAQETLGKANALTDKAQAYQEDVKSIAHGDLGDLKQLPNAIEERAKNLDEVKELEKQTGELGKLKEMAAKGNDTEALKEMGKQHAVSYAKDHFAGQQAALTAAMDKMSKLKTKYSQVTSLKDLSKRAPNAMKGKPLIERFVPGVTLQIQKTHNLLIDLNPVLSFRFTGRFSAGAGWNERISFSKCLPAGASAQAGNQTVALDRTYGPRSFASFSLKRGFAMKAEGEKMNVFIPPFALNPDAGSRMWVWSVFVGIKKDYRLMKKVKGNFQVLYNVYDDHDQSPYTERLNVRMGIEFKLKTRSLPSTTSRGEK